MRNGIVYALSHTGWIDELIVSARSCRTVMPDLERELYATSSVMSALDDSTSSLFTKIIELKTLRHRHRPRFESVLQTDLDIAIFIDSDTFFVEPVYELFDIFEHYDIAVYPAPQLIHPDVAKTGVDRILPAVSKALPEWNTGLIAARIDDGFRALMNEWDKLFSECEKNGYLMDQFSFRVAMATCNLRVATLPNNYNFRAHMPNLIAETVKILHAHGELEQIAKTINSVTDTRLYMPNSTLIHGFYPKGFDPT